MVVEERRVSQSGARGILIENATRHKTRIKMSLLETCETQSREREEEWKWFGLGVLCAQLDHPALYWQIDGLY